MSSHSRAPQSRLHSRHRDSSTSQAHDERDVADRLWTAGAAGGRPLDPLIRRDMERCFQTDFSAVRIHDDPAAAASAKALSAKAYTFGRDIYFGQGRFAPDTTAGQRLIAHELAHVVQQARGGDAPALGPSGSLEQSADAAADTALSGAGPVAVHGSSGVGVARQKDGDDDEDDVADPSTLVQLHKQREAALTPKKRDDTIYINNWEGKGKGTLAETTVPFGLYSGWDWNHIGGGFETSSSRTSLARQTPYSRDPSAGIDFIVENTKTGRLVIGEQKATKGGSFNDATATTVNLETNLNHAVDTLQKKLDSGDVHPDAVEGLKNTIARLKATQDAIKNKTDLPEGVVFELTNLGGKGEKIGKNHIDNLAKKYEKHPEFLEHLLSRTFVRDPELAKKLGRDQGGKRGTDADPDIVPAKEILTKDAQDTLERIRQGKTEKQWKAEQDAKKAAEKKAAEEERTRQKEAKAAERKRKADEKAAEKKQKKAAKKSGADAEEPKKKTKAKKPDVAADAATAPKAEGPKAKGKGKPKATPVAEASPAEKPAAPKKPRAKKADAPSVASDKPPPQKKSRSKKKAAPLGGAKETSGGEPTKEPAKAKAQPDTVSSDKPPAAAKTDDGGKSEKKPPTDTETTRKKPSPGEHEGGPNKRPSGKPSTGDKVDAAGGKVGHLANEAAALVRAWDSFEENKGKGTGAAALAAAKTYLDNSNLIMGAVANAEAKQKDGQDPIESWISTIGETGAGFIVPGSGIDQGINGIANLMGAVDDHNQKNDPNAAENSKKANLRTGTDFIAGLTPSKMFSETIGAGARAYYDIGKFLGGDTSGVDKFGDDAAKGKLGMIFQPWGMAADFFGNLGSGEGAGRALDKTLDKAKGSTIEKLGSASGDAFFELGQSKEAKSGKYGPVAQGWAAISSIGTDLINDKPWDEAINNAIIPGDGGILETAGNAMGDAAFASVERTKKLINEDIPQAKAAIKEKAAEFKAEAVQTYEEAKQAAETYKDKAVETYEGAKETVSEYASEKYESAKELASDLTSVSGAKKRLASLFSW